MGNMNQKVILSTSETSPRTGEESMGSEPSTLCPVCKRGCTVEVHTVLPGHTVAFQLLCFLMQDTH